MSDCISTPISWLRLEQYALGELDDLRGDVRAHLAACGACASCLARIEADGAVDLPPLPGHAHSYVSESRTAAPSAVAPSAVAPIRHTRRARAIAILGTGLALAAALLLAVGRRTPVFDTHGEDSVRMKGAAFAFTLVRDDEAVFAEAGGTFRGGDRFKVLVTCPPGAHTQFDLVVYDSHGASFPLVAPTSVECGNDVPLAGAFRITGAENVRVCLVWNDTAPSREELLTEQGVPSTRSACKELTSAAAP